MKKLLKKLIQKPVWLTLLLLVSAVVLSVLHNVFYAIFGFEEAVFFILSLLCGLGFVIALIYTIIKLIIRWVKK